MSITVLHTRIVTGTGGGPDKTILASPAFLAGTRYRELACFLHPAGDPGFEVLRARAAVKDCPILGVPEHFALDPRSLTRLAALCRRHDVRIWHGHDYKTNLFGVLLQPWLGFRLVSTVHGWVSHGWRTPLYYGVDRWALRRHEHVVAVSRDLFDACRAAGIPDRALSLIENGIDTEDFRRDRPAAASPLRAAIPPGRLVIGAVGRLSPEKGFDLLIEAVGTLLREGFDFELWIAGEGAEHDRLAALAAEAAPDGRIRLLGFRADLPALFEAFDIFCLSSRREGLPNVLLEAMAMEVPAVATRAGGVGAFAEGRDDMLLTDIGSAPALTDALRMLLRSPELRARLAGAARQRVEQECGFAARMRKMAAMYDALLDAPAPRDPHSSRPTGRARLLQPSHAAGRLSPMLSNKPVASPSSH